MAGPIRSLTTAVTCLPLHISPSLTKTLSLVHANSVASRSHF